MRHSITILAAFLGIMLVAPFSLKARTVYLNGRDISSARGQTLNKVNLKIDENGDLFIEAPHYQLNEHTTYTPLSTFNKMAKTPEHVAPSHLNPNEGSMLKGGEAPANAQIPESPATKAPVENDPAKLQDKPGEKTGGL